MAEEYQENSIIGDRYEVLQILGGEGQSGIGIVFVVRDLKRTRKSGSSVIVLKSLQKKYLEMEKSDKSFRSEALAWVLLEKFPYIVNALYVINIKGRPFIALEFIAPDKEGRNSLTHYLETPISLKEFLEWSIQICLAMEYCASRGLTPHRDIKPDNIMITNTGIAKLTDFGLAKFLLEGQTIINLIESGEYDELSASFLRVTDSGYVGGSIPWMAPEHFEGIQDMRTDIYSFGCVLYQMASGGRRPFRAFSTKQFYEYHKNKEPRPLKTKLWPIIKKCLEKNPDDRYQDFEEIRKDLEDLFVLAFKTKPDLIYEREELDSGDYFNKGVSFKTLKFYDEAIEAFKEAIRLDPRHYEAHYQLGSIYLKNGWVSFACDEFKETVEIKSHSFEAHKKLADSLKECYLINEAIEEYLKVLELKPDFFEVYFTLSEAYEILEDYEKAILNIETLISEAPSNLSNLKKEAKKLKKRLLEKQKQIAS